MSWKTSLFFSTLLLLVAVPVTVGPAQEYLPDLDFQHPAIQYYDSALYDAVTQLAEELESGDIELAASEDDTGYLVSILEELDINIDSQALVFSKTSFQAPKIAPDNPRAIFFNDDVAVAYVRGSEEIEIASIDPSLGPIFYTANINKVDKEGFERHEICLTCHLGPATSGVPGLFVGSVFPGPTGSPSPVDAIITDHRTAFADRWGGWYVNASSGQQKDRSNAIAPNPAQPLVLDEFVERNLTHLFGKVNTNGYLSPVSDIVGLMTFEHQTQMVNYITRVGWEERIAEYEGERDQMQQLQIDTDIDALVSYMLFAGEVPLKEPVVGVSSFTETFPKRGIRDSRGRSLRDFDLETRLFRYPLSYMIYSESFNALPERVKGEIYLRLFDVLSGGDRSERFLHLSASDRRSILEILRETKAGLPDYFRVRAN